jgi:ATP-dependent DNA helicase RecQ
MDLRAALRARFGFDDFLPGQRQVCEALLAGRSALAVFPTGGGKSMCYQLPALLLDGLTLVVSPLIALMKDQVDFLRARGLPAARLDSSLGAGETAGLLDDLVAGRLRILYVAPERFLNERFLDRLRRARVALLAVDEAHCISQWGHNFRPDYLELAALARELAVERVLALTATATPAVVDDIAAAFGIAPGDRVLTGVHRPNLELDVVPVTPQARDAALLEAGFPGPTIVYVTLQATAERVAALLVDEGVAARAYHAGMDPDDRAAVQDWFMAADGPQVVVATIAFGMGIDKANLRAVYHYNLPKGLESYAQEIGRAGRDGGAAICRMFACRDDLPTLANFAHGDTPTRAAVAGVTRALLGGDDLVEVGLRALSDAHDMRELVVKTLVVYLELDGFLRRATPIYGEYRWKLLAERDRILGAFDGERRAFLTALLDAATTGPVWSRVDLADAAARLGQPRDRLVRALGHLEEKGWIELQASGVRQRLRVVRRPDDLEALVDSLVARFEELERREVERLDAVIALIEGDGCLWARLAAHFGETLAAACGHCVACRTGAAIRLPPRTPPPAPAPSELAALRREHAVLAEPRPMARFLCGISSPAIARARLSRHPKFGSHAGADFAAVLAAAGRPS